MALGFQTKRHLVQLLAALLYNLDFQSIATLSVSKSPAKGACVPGLHCYSCPGAQGACPIGALQQSLSASGLGMGFYVVGTLLAFGALFGRSICGWACPFGFLQDMLDKLGRLLRVPAVKKGRWSRRLSWLKYAMVALVVVGPLAVLAIEGAGKPLFCAYVCPAGTLPGVALVASNPGLQAAVGLLFAWKVAVLVVLAVAALAIYRPFCRFLCPLGALYGFFNRFCVLRWRVDESACTHCGACVTVCRMDVAHVSDRECIQCGACAKACDCGAITFSIAPKRLSGNGSGSMSNVGEPDS